MPSHNRNIIRLKKTENIQQIGELIQFDAFVKDQIDMHKLYSTISFGGFTVGEKISLLGHYHNVRFYLSRSEINAVCNNCKIRLLHRKSVDNTENITIQIIKNHLLEEIDKMARGGEAQLAFSGGLAYPKMTLSTKISRSIDTEQHGLIDTQHTEKFQRDIQYFFAEGTEEFPTWICIPREGDTRLDYELKINGDNIIDLGVILPNNSTYTISFYLIIDENSFSDPQIQYESISETNLIELKRRVINRILGVNFFDFLKKSGIRRIKLGDIQMHRDISSIDYHPPGPPDNTKTWAPEISAFLDSMRHSNKIIQKIENVINTHCEDFYGIALIAGLNPMTDFINADLSNLYLSDSDLREFDFSNAIFFNTKLNNSKLSLDSGVRALLWGHRIKTLHRPEIESISFDPEFGNRTMDTNTDANQVGKPDQIIL